MLLLLAPLLLLLGWWSPLLLLVLLLGRVLLRLIRRMLLLLARVALGGVILLRVRVRVAGACEFLHLCLALCEQLVECAGHGCWRRRKLGEDGREEWVLSH